MTRLLAVSWNVRSLQYVYAESDRRNKLRAIAVGTEDLPTDPAAPPEVLGTILKQLVTKLKAEKSRLLILLNRGSVDSATFTVPPASDSELASLVRNMATREIPGTTDDTPIDFIAYPPAENGTRSVSAMALVGEDLQLARTLMKDSGCSSARLLIGTHPLKAIVPEDQRQRRSLIISRGPEAADVLLTAGELPALSRTIRLAAGVPVDEINRFLTSETQRTLISAGGQTSELFEVDQIFVTGNEAETSGLDDALSRHFEVPAVAVRPSTMIDLSSLPVEQQSIADSGSFSGQIAALLEESAGIPPVIDFANPRRPAEKANTTGRLVAVAAALTLIAGGAWYYVSSQLSELDAENSILVSRLNELNQTVRDTASRRRLAASLEAWENNRFSWPDELSDLTRRTPPGPGMAIQQLTISPAGSGRVVASFRGSAQAPAIISQLESNLRDQFHDLRIPGIREQVEGNKTTWSFQTSMTIRRRSPAQYRKAAPTKDDDSDNKQTSEASKPKTSAPKKRLPAAAASPATQPASKADSP
jgi:hypothetical protein